MASSEQVKRYIASWLQLGRTIAIDNSSGTVTLSANKVVEGDKYTREFESIWQQVSGLNSQNSYLEGTSEPIAQLLTPRWEIVPCSVCNMLVTAPQVGIKIATCPCHDLPSWPDNSVPVPTGAINSQVTLQEIRDRLLKSNSQRSQQPLGNQTDSDLRRS
jgi:hypothetical protein